MVFGLDTLEDQLKHLINLGNKAIICHGAPGTGKTYTVQKLAKKYNKVEESDLTQRDYFVQFHPSYDYTDFVEGLRPAVVKTEGTCNNKETSFVRLDGNFKQFCRKVVKYNKNHADHQDKIFIFIIDEINRADLAKVFGEIMFNVEQGKRGEDNVISTQYSNLPTYEINDGQAMLIPKAKDDFADGFYIPENVVIIGTMNDVDRSVESIDFAMRRRFKFIEVDANIEMCNSLEDVINPAIKGNKESKKKFDLSDNEEKAIVEQLKTDIQNLNYKISGSGEKESLGKEYQIGQAYFVNFLSDYNHKKNSQENENTLSYDKEAYRYAKEQIWTYSLEPLIKEYLRGKRTNIKPDIYKEAFLGE